MDVLVIVPTYNERENLPALVPAILIHPSTRVLIIDDQSPDGTGAVADRLAAASAGRVEVIHRTGPRGLGRSYLDGMRRALATKADLICQMDADLSHDPEHLPDLIAAAADHDLVIGSRYLNGISVVNWPLRRIALSLVANRYIRAVTWLDVRDCTSGFRCWRRAALSRLSFDDVRSEGYAFLVEMLYEAARHRCRIVEVPIVFVERKQGQSKLSLKVLLESLVTPWRLVLRRHHRHSADAALRED